jgi:hypothetical protein
MNSSVSLSMPRAVALFKTLRDAGSRHRIEVPVLNVPRVLDITVVPQGRLTQITSAFRIPSLGMTVPAEVPDSALDWATALWAPSAVDYTLALPAPPGVGYSAQRLKETWVHEWLHVLEHTATGSMTEYKKEFFASQPLWKRTMPDALVGLQRAAFST